MNIIFVIASLEGFGGTNRVATSLANGLSKNHNITVISKHSHRNTYQLSNRVKDTKFEGNSLSFISQCNQYIALNYPDIVIIHTMGKLTPALLIGGIKAQSIWSIEHISYDFHSLLYKQLRKRLYKKVDKIITLTKNDALNYKPFHSDVTVMANPTPLQLKTDKIIGVSKTLNNIVSIGRLTYQKGFDRLIKAWSLVEAKYPNWTLSIYGEGEDKEKLEKIIMDKNLKNIILKGLTNDIQAAYDNAAFYVMSSRFEGLPVVLIEAQSRGLPIVSFDCPSGPAEIVHHNIDGLLVENGNTVALANAMIKMMEEPQLRQKMANQALKSAQAYHIDEIIEQWLHLLKNS